MALSSDELSNLLQRLQKVAPWRSNPIIKFNEGMIHLFPANTRPGQRDTLLKKVRHAVERFVNEIELGKIDPSTYCVWIRGNEYVMRMLSVFQLDEEAIRELAGSIRTHRKVMSVKVDRCGDLIITTHSHKEDKQLMSDLRRTLITTAACKHAV
jgi:hypothetical protein